MSKFTEVTMFMPYRWGITLRVKGYGFIFRHAPKWECPLFSERYGYRKVYRFRGFLFEWLKP